jgi:hypothetical protein
VSKKFGEWYQKTNKTEDTNKLTLLAFKIIAILHNTRLATFIKLLETVSKSLFSNRPQNSCHRLLDCRRAAAIPQPKTASVVPPEYGRLLPETCRGLRHNKVIVKVKVY